MSIFKKSEEKKLETVEKIICKLSMNQSVIADKLLILDGKVKEIEMLMNSVKKDIDFLVERLSRKPEKRETSYIG